MISNFRRGNGRRRLYDATVEIEKVTRRNGQQVIITIRNTEKHVRCELWMSIEEFQTLIEKVQ